MPLGDSESSASIPIPWPKSPSLPLQSLVDRGPEDVPGKMHQLYVVRRNENYQELI